MGYSIPYGRQSITEQDEQAVLEALRHDFLTQGPAVEKFEREFAAYIGSKYCVAVANGTAALHLSVLALGAKGKKVLTSPITFAASANAILYAGGTPEFVDIDPTTYTIDVNAVEQAFAEDLNNDIAGVIPVDLAGYPVDTVALKAICDRYGKWLLEDACHAPGASFTSNSKQVRAGDGTHCDAAIFSFHPVKHIAMGEGGAITTNSPELYQALATLRTHGITKDPALLQENHGGWYYEMHDLGYNYRVPDILCALGSSQLSRAEAGLQRRREIARVYNEELTLLVRKPKIAEDVEHAYHLYVIQTPHRKELYDALRESGIYAQVHYIPVHMLPYYSKMGWSRGDLPIAEAYYDQCLSLPMYPTLTDEELQYVIKTVNTVITSIDGGKNES